MHWMILPLKRYAEFSGRSTRTEYWLFALFQLLLYALLLTILFVAAAAFGAGAEGKSISDVAVGIVVGSGMIFFVLLWLGLLIPNLALIARRMQDQDIPGWVGIALWVSGIFIGITSLVLLVFSFIPGSQGPNKYGRNPRNSERDIAETFG